MTSGRNDTVRSRQSASASEHRGATVFHHGSFTTSKNLTRWPDWRSMVWAGMGTSQSVRSGREDSEPMIILLVDVRDDDFCRLLPEELGGSQPGEERIKVMGFPPLGIQTLEPVLRQKGHRVRLFDTCHPRMKEPHIAEAVRTEAPDAVGLSFLSTTAYPAVKQLARRLKTVAPAVPIIAGGVFATMNAEQMLRDCSDLDCVGVGEGEELLPDFLEHLDDPGEVAGLVWRCEGQVVKNAPRPLLKNLDQFPYPALGKYPLLTDNLGPSLFRKTAALAQTLKDCWLGTENKYYRRLITASGARLIHTHYGPTGWEAIGLKRQTHLPLVVSFYGGDAYWLPTNFPIWRRRYLDLWRAADAIIVKGPKMKQRLVELGCPQSKIRIIDHGVNLAKIPFRPRRRQPGEPVRLLSACTLVDYKGVSHTVQAVALVRLALPQLHLTIFGSGPQEKQIKKLINELKLDQVVSLKPFLAWGKLIKACGRYQLFIHPSYTTPDNKQEGVPTSLIERAASGMPVIATRHADIPEIVKNGINGYLVPENDVQALAGKLITLVNQPERWRKFGQNGRKLVVKSFDAVKQTAVREQLYASLIAGNASRKYVRSGNAAGRR